MWVAQCCKRQIHTKWTTKSHFSTAGGELQCHCHCQHHYQTHCCSPGREQAHFTVSSPFPNLLPLLRRGESRNTSFLHDIHCISFPKLLSKATAVNTTEASRCLIFVWVLERSCSAAMWCIRTKPSNIKMPGAESSSCVLILVSIKLTGLMRNSQKKEIFFKQLFSVRRLESLDNPQTHTDEQIHHA